MTASTRVEALSGDFYAPGFEISLRGADPDPVLAAHVRELKVDLDLRKLGTAEIKFSSYDDAKLRLLPSPVELNDRVLLRLGYAGKMSAVLLGSVVTIAPDFPEDGSPVLTVRVTDSLAQLKASKPARDSVLYRNVTDAQIAEQIGRRYGLTVDAAPAADGPRHELVSQRNLDDILFLKERAMLIDCHVWMDVDPDSGAERLRFGGPADGRDASAMQTFVLAWGWLENGDVPPSLLSFKPTKAVGEQVRSVEVRGWDVHTKKPIVARATRAPEKAGDQGGPEAAAELGGDSGRQDVVVDRPVASADEAKKLAEALLADRSYRFFTAHGRTIGLPALRPGHNVEIHGVGPDFSRTYYVEHVAHTFSDKGFFTEFDARRSVA